MASSSSSSLHHVAAPTPWNAADADAGPILRGASGKNPSATPSPPPAALPLPPGKANSAAERVRQLSAAADDVDVASAYARVRFRWKRFLPSLVWHLLHPLTTPLAYLLSGSDYARNVGFVLRCSLAYMLQAHLMYCTVPAVIVLYVVFRPENVEFSEVLLAVLLHVFHKLMVAVKFAYMYDADYRAIYGPLADRGVEIRRRTQLLTGWMRVSRADADYEVRAAAVRLNIRHDGPAFVVPASDAEGLELFFGRESAEPVPAPVGGVVRVPVCLFVARAVELGSDMTRQPFAGFGTLTLPSKVCGLVAAAVPTLSRLAEGKNALGDGSVQAAVLIALCFQLTLFYFAILLEFLAIAAEEYRRRATVLKIIGAVVSPPHRAAADAMRRRRGADQMSQTERALTTVGMPYADLTNPVNVVAFLRARQLAQNYGLAYRRRVDLYATGTILLVLVLAVFVAIELLYYSLGLTPAVLSVYTVAVCSLYLARAAVYGLRADRSASEHLLVLVRTQLAVRELVAGFVSSQFRAESAVPAAAVDERVLHATDDLLGAALESAVQEREFTSLKLFGLGGTGALQLLVFVLMSGLSVAYHLYTNE